MVGVLILISCTGNQRSRLYGGTTEIKLPKNHKLVTVTWKETNIWYLTKPMIESDKPETYHFNEESNWGVVEGDVIFIETK